MIVRANNTSGALRRAQKKVSGRVAYRKITANRVMTIGDWQIFRSWMRSVVVDGFYSDFYSTIDPPVFVVHLYVDEDHADKVALSIKLRLSK